jgi:hypothetical protein
MPQSSGSSGLAAGSVAAPVAAAGSTPVAATGTVPAAAPVAAAVPAADGSVAAPAAAAAAAAVDDLAGLTNVPVGATIKLDAADLGAQPGRVSVVAGNLVLPASVVSWTEKTVSITVPQVELTGPTKAKFIVRRADGSVANETPFQLSDRSK